MPVRTHLRTHTRRTLVAVTCLVAAVACLAGTPPSQAIAQVTGSTPRSAAPLRGTVRPVAPSFSPGAVARLRVTLDAAQELSGVSLVISLRHPSTGRLLRRQTVDAPGLTAGASTYDFGVALGASGGGAPLEEGVYPFDAAAFADGRRVWRASGTLIVVDPKRRPPLNVALVWQLDEGLHIGPDGVFEDEVIERAVSRAEGSQGLLAGHAAQLAAHRGVRASVALAPLTASQVQRLSRGAARRAGGRTVAVAADSSSAGDARHALARWRGLFKLARVQALGGPYAPAPLEELARRGLASDIDWQLAEGAAVLEDALGLAPARAIVRPAPTTATASALARRGVTTLVVSAAALSSAGGRTPDRPLRLASDPRARVLAYDPALSERLLSSADPPAALDRLMRDLAVRHLRGDRLVVLAPPVDRPQLEPAGLGRVYESLERAAWVRMVTVEQGVKLVPPYSRPATLPASAPRMGAESFWNAASRSRDDYRAFEDMTAADNRLRRSLKRAFLVGESALARSTALAWQKAMRRSAGEEFAKVRLSASREVVLTGQRGKVAFSLANGTGYVVRPTLALSGEGVAFPDGRRERLDLRPKETVHVVRVALVGATTRGKAVARLTARSRTLGRAVIAVRSTYIGRLSVVAGIILALVGLLLYLWRRGGRADRPGPPTRQDPNGAAG